MVPAEHREERIAISRSRRPGRPQCANSGHCPMARAWFQSRVSEKIKLSVPRVLRRSMPERSGTVLATSRAAPRDYQQGGSALRSLALPRPRERLRGRAFIDRAAG